MFLSHNIVFKGKNQAKVMYFMKLAILIFGCPGDMHITNCTRMPHQDNGDDNDDEDDDDNDEGGGVLPLPA